MPAAAMYTNKLIVKEVLKEIFFDIPGKASHAIDYFFILFHFEGVGQ